MYVTISGRGSSRTLQQRAFGTTGIRNPGHPDRGAGTFQALLSRAVPHSNHLKVCTPTAASMPSNKRKLQLESVPRQSKRSATKAVYETTDTGEQITMSYAGWRPSDPSTAEFVRRKYRDVTPKTFWAKYVTQRRPTVLSGGLEHSEFRKLAGWNLDLLEHRAGDATVDVEVRDGEGDSFGKGRRAKMAFRNVLQQLRQDEQSLYLTTQEGPEEEHATILRSPVSHLSNDITLQPELTGKLIPQTINLWLGASSAGASSGLHHDFHDNLYILLRGRKRFQLWSPDCALQMHTHGDISKVHPNGRIVYCGQGDVLPDGSRIEDRVCRQGGALEYNGEDSDADLEAALDGEITELNGVEDERAWKGRDDYKDSTEEEAGGDGEGEPPSFSRVDLSQSAEAVARDFPGFPGTVAAMSCNLEAGEMLYLPAGWFHNVVSMSGAAGNDGSYHMALNYWFHPPDNLDPSGKGFSRPYSRTFWPDLWKNQQF